MAPARPTPVILFDGVCNLCNALVRFVIRHDPSGIFRFAAQQSPIGQALNRREDSRSRACLSANQN
jgi:predicted DCC family thiol-disulfide oxidoreductase YuxK